MHFHQYFVLVRYHRISAKIISADMQNLINLLSFAKFMYIYGLFTAGSCLGDLGHCDSMIYFADRRFPGTF